MSETATEVTPAAPVEGAVAVSETPVVTESPTESAPVVETKTPEPVAPVVYDLTLPEGSPLDPSALERTVAIARERGLSAEQAQAMVAVAHEEATHALKAIQPGGAKWTAEVTAWEAASLADPELGAGKPERLAQKVEAAKTALARFGSPEFNAFLDKSGFGSHPDVLKVFARIADASAEPSFTMGGTHTPTPTDSLKQMYPSMYPH